MATAEGPVELSEEDHKKLQEYLNPALQNQDQDQLKKNPDKFRKMASSLDLLFTAPDIKGFFAERKFSHLAWAVFLIQAIAFVLLLVLMVAPGWGFTREIRGSKTLVEGEVYGKYGLWYVCWELVNEPGTRVDCRLITALSGIPGWFHGCQAMVVLATIVTIVAIGNSGAYICAKSMNGNQRLIASVVVLSGVSAIFTVATFVLFAVQFLLEAYWCCAAGVMEITDYQLSYCFIICCCVPAVDIIGAIVASMEVSRLRRIERKRRYAEQLAEQQPGDYPYHYDPYRAPYGYYPAGPYMGRNY